jgi:hypothetical protein
MGSARRNEDVMEDEYFKSILLWNAIKGRIGARRPVLAVGHEAAVRPQQDRTTSAVLGGELEIVGSEGSDMER